MMYILISGGVNYGEKEKTALLFIRAELNLLAIQNQQHAAEKARSCRGKLRRTFLTSLGLHTLQVSREKLSKVIQHEFIFANSASVQGLNMHN